MDSNHRVGYLIYSQARSPLRHRRLGWPEGLEPSLTGFTGRLLGRFGFGHHSLTIASQGIGQLPLPAWLLARGGSERGSRTRDLLVMGQVLCHLSYLAVGKGGVELQSVPVSERRSNLLSCLPMNFLA